MSKYLKPGQVMPKSFVGIHGVYEKDLEGIAELVKPIGQPLPFQDEDLDPLCIRQRWLIEWASCDKAKEFLLNKQQMMSQSILAGKRCVRSIEFYADKKWRDRVMKTSVEFRDLLDDNFNGLF